MTYYRDDDEYAKEEVAREEWRQIRRDAMKHTPTQLAEKLRAIAFGLHDVGNEMAVIDAADYIIASAAALRAIAEANSPPQGYKRWAQDIARRALSRVAE